jgi:hypothetical protein
MKYQLSYTDKAAKDFAALRRLVRRAARLHAMTLAESPSSLSRPAVSPPFAPGGMISEFTLPVGETLHHVVFFFMYTADETTLRIMNIDYSALSGDDSNWNPPD